MNSDLPPPNRAIGWYRFMLWVMPTCVAITTALGIIWLGSAVVRSLQSQTGVLVWFVVNIASTFVIGAFEARFHRAQQGSSKKASLDRVARFVATQILLVPLLTCAVVFALCSSGFY